MNNKIVSDFGRTYKRLSKPQARKAFEDGEELYVMSIDRTPTTSLSYPHVYCMGCRPIMRTESEYERINTFDDLLEDFSTWLDSDGYGHMPQRYDARNYRFSYWLRLE